MTRESWRVDSQNSGSVWFVEHALALQWIAQNNATGGACVLTKVVTSESIHSMYGIGGSAFPTIQQQIATQANTEQRTWVKAK